ncbi:MAG: metallophosphoesterase [Pyrinomonadaceae bacterium]
MLLSASFAYSQEKFPLKIGMVADSQLTTQNGTYNEGMRSRIADRFVNVAIRPVAVEVYEKYILASLLEKMANSKDKPDIILYLGDIANSGCADEINTGISVLREFQIRQKNTIPIFIVVGNHDYLGMGNTVNSINRAKICERNPTKRHPNLPLTKFEFISKVAKFNRESAKILGEGYEFVDDFDELKELVQKHGTDCHDHQQYFYSALLRYHDTSAQTNTEILLSDTSDYADFRASKRETKNCAKGTEFWGAFGGISYKETESRNVSQIDFLRNKLAPSNQKTNFRMIASHYPPDSLFGAKQDSEDDIPKDENFVRALRELWLEGGKNYWLYGHTHTSEPKYVPFKLDESRVSMGVNVGSTIDFNPHLIVFGNVSGDGTVSSGDNDLTAFREFTLDVSNNPKQVEEVLRRLDEFKSVYAIKLGGYSLICASGLKSVDPKTTFGLDKAYRKKCWTDASYPLAAANLARFIKKTIGKKRGSDSKWTREELIETLFYIGVTAERPK